MAACMLKEKDWPRLTDCDGHWEGRAKVTSIDGL
jgi:hypothetical protein